MNNHGRSLLVRYGIAIACTLVATWLRSLAGTALADEVLFVAYFPAVFITALYAGFGPALLVVVLSLLAAARFATIFTSTPYPTDPAGWTELILFTLFGIGVGLLCEGMRRKSALAQQEGERFSVTLASIGDAVIVTDRQAHVTFLNPVAEQLTGWTHTAAQGQPLTSVFRIIDGKTRGPIERPIEKALQQGRTVGLADDTILICRDGTERAIDDSAAPIRQRDGKIDGVVLVFRDVTEQRELQLQQGRLAALVDSSEDAILSQTFEGIVTSWNQGAVRLFGFTAEEVIGKPIYETIATADRKEELLEVLQRVRQGERVDHFSTVRHHKNGREIPVAVRVSPIRDGSGKIIGASAIDRDMSQHQAAEQRRNARLAVTQVLAQERSLDKAIGEILATVCKSLDMEVGCFWRVQLDEQLLRCQRFWHTPSCDYPEFQSATMEHAFQEGDSLPGRVWKSGQAIWIPDVVTDPEFLRNRQARQSGLHGGFACPIAVDERFLGVIEFFSHEIQQPDEDLLETMATIGGQIGQFIERRESEQKLRRSERELSDFFENAAIGLHWASPDGTILRVNQTELDVLGYRREEYVGRNIAEFHADQDVIAEILRDLNAGKQLRDREARMLCKDGTIKDVLIDSNVLWEDGRFIHTRCFTRDITRRKRMERSLRFLAEASRSLSSLVDFKSTLKRVSDMAVPAFADWCIVDMADSEGNLQRLSVVADDPAKLPIAEELYHRYPPDPYATHGVANVFRTGESVWVAQIDDALLEQLARDADHLRIIRGLGLRSYMCVPLKTPDKVLGVMTFVAAESGRIYGPDDLVMAEDLAHRAAIAMENARLYQEVRDADRRKDEFLAMLAHELRNPLAPIRSGLDVLAMDSSKDEKTIKLMQDQLEHVVRLVDDLLDVSRIMRGRIELRRQNVQLASLVQQSVQAVRSRVEQNRQKLLVTVPEQPLWLNADPVRLVQVLENLITNASKYTDAGGTIELIVEAHESDAVIRIRDNGIGIEPELLPHVFELFTQSSRSLDRAQGGLGIGLTLVQRLVQMHDGTVAAQSEGTGRGSTFIVTLPTVGASPQTTAPSVKPVATQPRRILVVDDNEGAAWMLSMLLQKLGDHQIDTAHDGPAALQKIQEMHPEIVLLDIGLPGMDGYEVAKTIRDSTPENGLLLVALTGYGQEEDRRRSQEAGFDEHLVKPPSVDQMKTVLAHPKLSLLQAPK